jgi:hypothetical protein
MRKTLAYWRYRNDIATKSQPLGGLDPRSD